jgi:hypothetical protein
MISIGLKVMTVNNDDETLPDILCDFNSRIERNLLKKIKEMDASIVMVIFDASVFKSMRKLQEMFIDMNKMLVPGGLFITEYKASGGMITYSDDIIEVKINDLNILAIPLMYANINSRQLSLEIVQQSQNIILDELLKHFIDVKLTHNNLYPFL